MTTPARSRYAGHRFPAEVISRAIWLYFRFPLGLRMVEEMLAARGIIVSHESVRHWARKFGHPPAYGSSRHRFAGRELQGGGGWTTTMEEAWARRSAPHTLA